MAKLPWTKWFSREWLSEKTIAKTSLAARGLWIEALNVMIANDTYKLEGSKQELATLLRCSVGDLNVALPNLQASNVGVVTFDSSGYVTLASRRLKRECIARANGRKRQSAFRERQGCNATTLSVSVSDSVSVTGNDGGPGEENQAGGVGVFHQLRGEIWAYFKRPETQRAGYEEEHLLAEISRSPSALDEWHTIRSSGHGFKRQSVLTLLQNWAGELDKARNYEAPPETDRNGKPVVKFNTLLPSLPDYYEKEMDGL